MVDVTVMATGTLRRPFAINSSCIGVVSAVWAMLTMYRVRSSSRDNAVAGVAGCPFLPPFRPLPPPFRPLPFASRPASLAPPLPPVLLG